MVGRVTVVGVTVSNQKATANYVPAAAVIRRVQALSGIIGRKGLVGGSSLWLGGVMEDRKSVV